MSDSTPNQPSHKSSQSTRRWNDPRTMRIVVAAVALIYGVIFISLNRSKVRIHFLFFTVTSRLWVGLLVCLILGAVLGQALGGSYRKRRSAAKTNRPPAPDRTQ
jgi:uncharacterized integral membrane protein